MKPDELKHKASADKEVVYVDVDDEITSIIDKLESSKAKVVALVLPKRAATLQSIVNMRLLARSAKNAGKNPVLVTTEAALLPLAGAAGLHVASSLESKPEVPPAPDVPGVPAAEEAAEVGTKGLKIKDNSTSPSEDLPSKIDYDKSVGELAEAHPETIELGAAEAEAATEKTPKVPKIKGLKVPNFDRFRLMMGLAIAGAIALIIFIILALFVLPKATIAITTTSTPVNASLTLNASDKTTSLDEKNSNIPATLKSSDQAGAQQVTATGQQNNGSKAKGTVSMSDQICGTVKPPTDVPAGTAISSSGLTYITQENTHFTASGTVNGSCITYPSSSNTDVTAQSGGTKFNIGPSTFSVSGRPDVTATSSSAFTGGTDNIQTVVSQNDVDGAKQKITSGTTADSFVKNFENTLAQQGLYVLTSTLKTADAVVTANPDVGQPASTTTVTVKVTYSVLTVKKADLQKAITDALNSQIDKSKQKVDDSTVLANAQVTVASQASPTTAVLNITEATSAIPILDITTVKKQAEGQKAGDVMASLNGIPGVKNVTVNLSPFWVSKVPKSAGKITVTIQHVNETSSGG